MSAELPDDLVAAAAEGESTPQSSGREDGVGLGEEEEGTGGWAVEENRPRVATERGGRAELRDVVDDALRPVFQRLDLKSLCAVERTCRRFCRLAKSPSLYHSIRHIKIVFGWCTMQGIWLEINYEEAGMKLESRISLERLVKQLASRGARPAVLELLRTVRVTSTAFSGLSLLRPRTLFVNCLGMEAQLVEDILRHRSLQCLVLGVETPFDGTVAAIRSGLRPASHPELRALLLFGKCWEESLPNGEARDFREAWEESQLVCFRTDEKERSFHKGPKDAPPHPDLLRLSRRIRWAH